MKRFRLHFRPTSVADITQTNASLDYESDQRPPVAKAAREQLRRWRQLKHHLA